MGLVVLGLCALRMLFCLSIMLFFLTFRHLPSFTTPFSYHSLCGTLRLTPKESCFVLGPLSLLGAYLGFSTILPHLFVIIYMLNTTYPKGLKSGITVEAEYILLIKKLHGWQLFTVVQQWIWNLLQAIRHDKFAAYIFIYFYPNVQDRPDHSSKTFWGGLKITHFHDWACEIFKDYEHD